MKMLEGVAARTACSNITQSLDVMAHYKLMSQRVCACTMMHMHDTHSPTTSVRKLAPRNKAHMLHAQLTIASVESQLQSQSHLLHSGALAHHGALRSSGWRCGAATCIALQQT